MEQDAWFLNLQQQHRELLADTRLLATVPVMWRELFGEWVREIEEAGAIEDGMRVESLSQKYDSLRAELVGASMGDPRWESFEVSLEDRSEQLARKVQRGV